MAAAPRKRRKGVHGAAVDQLAADHFAAAAAKVAAAAATAESQQLALPRHLCPAPGAGPTGGWRVDAPTRESDAEAAAAAAGGAAGPAGDGECLQLLVDDERRRSYRKRHPPAPVPPEALCMAVDAQWDVNTGRVFCVRRHGEWHPCLMSKCAEDGTCVVRLLRREEGGLRIADSEPFEVPQGWATGAVIEQAEYERMRRARTAEISAVARSAADGGLSSTAQLERALRARPEALAPPGAAQQQPRGRFHIVAEMDFPPPPQFGHDPRWPEGGFRIALDANAEYVPAEGTMARNAPCLPPPGAVCVHSGRPVEPPAPGGRVDFVGRQRSGEAGPEFILKKSLWQRQERTLAHLEFLWVSGEITDSVGPQSGMQKRSPLAGARSVELLWTKCRTPPLCPQQGSAKAPPHYSGEEGEWWVGRDGVITACFLGAEHRLVRIPSRQRLFPVPPRGATPTGAEFSEQELPYGVVLCARHARAGGVTQLRCMRGRAAAAERLRWGQRRAEEAEAQRKARKNRVLQERIAELAQRRIADDDASAEDSADSGDIGPMEVDADSEGFAGADNRRHADPALGSDDEGADQGSEGDDDSEEDKREDDKYFASDAGDGDSDDSADLSSLTEDG
eukprot:TRINITY_DN24512_c0_g1_i1.p1 TRINITY_DN24512_c0_g1~~TRINITY_DN24512_c0_g1_i1.p1  ORF type:complete len:642 (+),score=208.08 TRINITY_DN24512_c0_g1_i1:65-1927(+)